MSIPEHIVSRKLAAARSVGLGNNSVTGFGYGGKRYFAKIYKEEGCFRREVYALENFGRADIPVPEIAFKSACYGESGSCLLVTEKIKGTTLDKINLQRERYCYEVGRLLANIHAIEIPEAAPLLVIPVDELVSELNAFAESHEIRHPMLGVMRETLEELNRSGHAVLSHGDYISRHIFLCRGGVSGVVDWECLRVASPEVDLGHCAAFLEIFGRPGEESQFTSGYGEAYDVEIKNRLKLYYKIVFARYWKRLNRAHEYRLAMSSIKTQPA